MPLLWKPQKQEQKKRQDLLDNLKKGDKVVTIGGIYGTISQISEKRITLEIAENVEIEMVRNAVSGYQDPSSKNA